MEPVRLRKFYVLLVALLALSHFAPDQDIRAAELPSDSVPYLIITNADMASTFDVLALRKTKQGTPAEVVTVEDIAQIYQETDTVLSVRACISDYYSNKHTYYVLIGGDVTEVPGFHVHSLGQRTLTDMYYACLGGNWNADGDTIVGESLYDGDTVDYTPEVHVGRLPVRSSSEASDVIDKLISYESNVAQTTYQTRALSISSYLELGLEGDDLNQYYADSLSTLYTVSQLHEAGTSAQIAAIEAGCALIVNNSHAQNASSFMSRNLSNRETFAYDTADVLYHPDMYGVFINVTCYNSKLDDETWPVLARHFMINPAGGCIAYVGSTEYDWAHRLSPWHLGFLSRLMTQDGMTIGEALDDAKAEMTPNWDFEDSFRLMTFHGQMLLGDPQLRVWTSAPNILAIDCPENIDLDTDTIVVNVKSSDTAVANAKVCLMQEDSTVYEIGMTDANGDVAFCDLDLTSRGHASVVVTKHNCFVAEKTIRVGCCMGMTGNVDCSLDEVCDMSDLTRLIDYLQISFAPLCCPDEADLNRDSLVDIGDLTILIEYLLMTFVPPLNCVQ